MVLQATITWADVYQVCALGWRGIGGDHFCVLVCGRGWGGMAKGNAGTRLDLTVSASMRKRVPRKPS